MTSGVSRGPNGGGRQLPNFSSNSSVSESDPRLNNSTLSDMSRRTTTKQRQFKIICVGESMVGKTSLIQKYIDGIFNEHGT